MNKSNKILSTPILLIVFNRPQYNAGLISILKIVRPQKLYIAADGPRSSVENDKENCTEVRKIVEIVNWECEIRTSFQKSNLGCGKGVSAAIDWFFQNEEEGIILEDDCRPDESFFFYCEELLKYYRDDKRIMAISGSNYGRNPFNENDSYLFTQIPHVWGWATWRRAWKYYNFKISDWDYIKKSNWLETHLFPNKIAKRIRGGLDAVNDGELDTWDYQWALSCLRQNGLTIIPAQNLVSNIGFNEKATHTKETNNLYAEKAVHEISTPLNHPSTIQIVNDDNTKLPLKQRILKNVLRK